MTSIHCFENSFLLWKVLFKSDGADKNIYFDLVTCATQTYNYMVSTFLKMASRSLFCLF